MREKGKGGQKKKKKKKSNHILERQISAHVENSP
jgi:hypothetical protein